LREEILADIKKKVARIYFGGRLNNEFILGEVNLSVWNRDRKE